jgi:hypothetical protein
MSKSSWPLKKHSAAAIANLTSMTYLIGLGKLQREIFLTQVKPPPPPPDINNNLASLIWPL